MSDPNWSESTLYGDDDRDDTPSSQRPPHDDDSLPDDLPPVQPPSAGMIVQLFLIPAVIVAAIVGVYALFGRLASQELDWRQLVTDVRSENPHVRWRGALGLAQMLDADRQRPSDSEKLAANPQVAQALSDLYGELIGLRQPTEDELKEIEFLSKALGRMQQPDVIAPVFLRGIDPKQEREIRKHSMIGLAMLAGTARDARIGFHQPEVVARVEDVSREADPLFRQQAAFALGVIGSQQLLSRLETLLDDPDQMVRVNSAIGFARNDKTDGVPVFSEVLEESTKWNLDPRNIQTVEDEATYFERSLMVRNTIKAVDQLRSHLSEDQHSELTTQLRTVSEDLQDPALRTEALGVLRQMEN